MSYKTYCEYSAVQDALEVFIIEDRGPDRFLCTDLKNDSWEKLDPYSMRAEAGPTFRVSRMYSHSFMQSMADMLYEQGFRPKEEPVLENELTAVKNHLGDMKSIAFHGLGIKEERTDDPKD